MSRIGFSVNQHCCSDYWAIFVLIKYNSNKLRGPFPKGENNEEKGFVKIWELESHNWAIMKSMHSRSAVFFWFSLPSHSSVRILFCLPQFARPESRKTELRKYNLSSLIWAHCGTHEFFGDSRVNLSLQWLAQLSENTVDPGVENFWGRSLLEKQSIFLSAVFSNKLFF